MFQTYWSSGDEAQYGMDSASNGRGKDERGSAAAAAAASRAPRSRLGHHRRGHVRRPIPQTVLLLRVMVVISGGRRRNGHWCCRERERGRETMMDWAC